MWGSWLLLATLLIPEELAFDDKLPASSEVTADAVELGLAPSTRSGRWEIPVAGGSAVGTCAGCVRCLHACPTDAFVGPLHLDPQRCISYRTIESRSAIPRRLRQGFGNRIFGCDICQEVCPWNRRRHLAAEPDGRSCALVNRVAPPLLAGFAPTSPDRLDDGAFRARFARSPVLRTRRSGMLRNVCVALGNWSDPAAVPALLLALDDGDPLPRAHAAWALGRVGARHGGALATDPLTQRLGVESVDRVRAELQEALAEVGGA